MHWIYLLVSEFEPAGIPDDTMRQMTMGDHR
jgi:hypothetical protein